MFCRLLASGLLPSKPALLAGALDPAMLYNVEYNTYIYIILVLHISYYECLAYLRETYIVSVQVSERVAA